MKLINNFRVAMFADYAFFACLGFSFGYTLIDPYVSVLLLITSSIAYHSFNFINRKKWKQVTTMIKGVSNE